MSMEFEVPLVCLIFMVLLIIIYFSKRRVNLAENKMYESIIVFSFFEILINTIIHFICALNPFDVVVSVYYDLFNVLNKFLAVSFILVCASLFCYTLMITYDK